MLSKARPRSVSSDWETTVSNQFQAKNDATSRINAGPTQPIEETASAPLMPGRDLRTILALADAAIDEDCSSSRSKHEALDREPGLVAVADKKLRLQHSTLCLDHGRIESGQELRERKTKIVVIHDDVDDRIPDRKTHDELLLQCALRTM